MRSSGTKGREEGNQDLNQDQRHRSRYQTAVRSWFLADSHLLLSPQLSPSPLPPPLYPPPPPVPCAAVFTAQGCVSQTSLLSVRRLPPLGPGGGAEMLMKVVVMVVMNIWRHVLMAVNTSTSCVNVSRICSFLKNQESWGHYLNYWL